VEGLETPTLLGSLERTNLNHLALSKESSRVSVSLSSPEDGNGSSFQNVVFYIYLELHAVDKVQKPINFEYDNHR
jgi:hypothetical protein